MRYQIAISIVLYKNKIEEITGLLDSMLSSSLNIRIFLVDNSPTDELRRLEDYSTRISYYYCNKNLGYGTAHNLAIFNSENMAKYHLILNPDIELDPSVLEKLYYFMEGNEDVGVVTPKIFFKDGNLQRLCKLLPTPVDLFARRFFPHSRFIVRRNYFYEMKFFNYDAVVNVPNLSGCFLFFKRNVLLEVGGFDPRFFMYLEDVDLVRRVHRSYRTLFLPEVKIIHGYEKGSYNNIKLLLAHISSSIKYFNKWGWFYDRDRRKINNDLIRSLDTDK